jgi:quinol monooxygenase YgiN
MITIIAKAKAKPGKEVLLADESVKLAKLVRENEKGCLMYIPHVSTDNPAEIVFVEKYVDEAASNVHGQATYFKAFLEACQELLSEELQIQSLQELI